jgi:hypothetical protein
MSKTLFKYTPDFSLRVDDRCIYFKIERDLWFNGVRKSKYEVENSEMCNNIDINVSQSLNINDCRSSIATINTNQTLKKLSSFFGLVEKKTCHMYIF